MEKLLYFFYISSLLLLFFFFVYSRQEETCSEWQLVPAFSIEIKVNQL